MAIAVEAPAREDLSFRDNDDKLVGARWLKSDGVTPMVIVSAELAIEFDPPLPPDQPYVDARVFLPPETHIITSTTPGDPDGWINPTGLSAGVVLVTVPHGVWAAYATRSGRWDVAAVADDGTQRCLVRGLFHVEPGVATPTAPGGGGGSPTPFIISVVQTAPADFTFNTDEVPTTRAGHQNQWDFGDGATATEVVGVEVDHSYDTGGDYTITCYCHGYTATTDVTATVVSGGGGGTVYSDDFDRADSNPTLAGGSETPGVGLGSEWNGGSWGITSGQAVRHNNTDSGDFTTFLHDCGPDHWAEMTVVVGGESGVYNSLNVRRSIAGGMDCYMCFVAPHTDFMTIGKIFGGYSGIADSPGGSVNSSNGDKLRVEVSGANPTTIKGYFNDVLMVTTTDSSLDGTNHYCGMNAAPGSISDNFRCGPLPYTPATRGGL